MRRIHISSLVASAVLLSGTDFFLSDGQPSKTVGICFPDHRQCVFTNSENCRAAERQREKVESVQKGIYPKYSICHAQR